jgi:hypothetical protein
MPGEHSIALMFVTDAGKTECVYLDHRNLYEARKVAEQVMMVGRGLYIQVEIRAGGKAIETIRNNDLPSVPLTS